MRSKLQKALMLGIEGVVHLQRKIVVAWDVRDMNKIDHGARIQNVGYLCCLPSFWVFVLR